jgi:CubicO group peptidase (beta-lactamase class C family)
MSISKSRDLTSISDFIDGFVRDGRTNGAGLAASVAGKPVFEHYAGQARSDLDAGPEVLWPVASISKLYTAAAIMRMIEQGRLSLGMRVSTVLPAFSGDEREDITLRQLLTHTSGLPYESPQMADRLAARASLEEITDEANTLDLRFPPGTGQWYSDLGYAVAGRLAATVAGSPFDELVQAEVLEPAGLTGTCFPGRRADHGRIATVEGSMGYGSETAMYYTAYSLGLAHPAFGVVATLGDLLRFGRLFEPESTTRIHSRMAVQAMTTDQTGGDFAGEETTVPTGVIHAWGIGFMIKGRTGYPELVSADSYGHGGGSGCYLWIEPRHRITIAFVSNRHFNADPDDFMPRLEQAVSVTMSCLTR